MAAALGQLAHEGGEILHFGHGNLGLHNLQAVLVRVHAQNTTAPFGHVAHHVAGVVGGNMGLQGAHRLQNHGACLGQSGLIGQLGGHDEGHFAGVHGMVAAVQQGGLQANHRVARQHTVFGCLAQALFHRGEVVLGHAAAKHLLLEDQLFAVAGLELDPHVTELAVAAGLLFVAALRLALLANGFPVSHSGHGQIHIHAELRLQLGNHHIQMLLAQAADDLLAGLGIHAVGQGGILFHQAGQRAADLALVALLGHTDGHGQCGRGECGSRQLDHTAGLTQGIAGLGGGQLGHCADVARADGGGVGLLFALDVEQLAHALGLAGTGIYQSTVALQGAAGHLHIGQLAHEGIGHGLEYIGSQRTGGITGDLHRLTGGILSQNSGYIRRAGQQDLQVVQQHVQALLVHGAAAEHGGDGAAAAALGQAVHDLLGGEGLAGEELLHQFVVGLGHGLAHGGDQALQTVAHLGQLHLHLLAALILEGLLAEQVHIQDGAVVLPHGHNAGADAGAELGFQVFQNLVVVGVFQIGLVHEDDLALAVFLGQMERLFRANGHTRTGRHGDQHTLCCMDALVHAQLKIKQAGGVDEIQLHTVVLHGGHSSRQAGVTLLLLGIKVAHGVAVLYGAGTLHFRVGAEQQCFDQGGLAAAGMAGYQDVSDVFVGVIHKLIPSLLPPVLPREIAAAAIYTKILSQTKNFLKIMF